MQALANDRPPDRRSIFIRPTRLSREIPKSADSEIHALLMTGHGGRCIL